MTNDPTKRRAGNTGASDDEAPGDYERVDPDDVVDDAIDLFGAGSDDEEQVAEPIDDEPGPIPNT